MKSPETGLPEQNRGEQVASKMYDVLDRVEQPQNHEALSKAGNEFANKNYDLGQRILEKNGFWHDTVREVAAEANRAEREKKDNVPLSFAEAKSAISGYAKALAESGTREDRKSALEIESIISGTGRPGMEGIDNALKYIEGVLKTKAQSERKMTPDMKREWDEQRAVRDALFAEKIRRLEKPEQKQELSDVPISEGFDAILKRSKKQDEKELAEARESLGLDEKAQEKIPTDERGLFKYYKDNFGKVDGLSLKEFEKEFTPEVRDKYRAYVTQLLKTQIEGNPASGRYADTVAAVLMNNPTLLQRIVSLKEGRVIDMDRLLHMPFSEVAKKYLGIDLPKDYFDNFSPR